MSHAEGATTRAMLPALLCTACYVVLVSIHRIRGVVPRKPGDLRETLAKLCWVLLVFLMTSVSFCPGAPLRTLGSK